MRSIDSLLVWKSILCIIILLVFIGPFFSVYGPNEMNLAITYQAPGPEHVLGTDHLGRDVLTRLLEGGKVTLLTAAISVLLSFGIGVLYGGISGYFGGMVDSIMMRILEAFLVLPSLVVILAFQVFAEGNVWSLGAIIGITNWLLIARIVRSEFVRLKNTEFVQVARMLGTPIPKILLQHLLRNSLPAVFVVTLFNFTNAIYIEVSLSFLGIGIPPAIPSWGSMLHYAQNDILTGAWWIAVFPGILILLTVLALNFIGESIKDAYGG